MKNFALLKPDSKFYALFPNGLAPIRNILIARAGVMEGEGIHEFYDLDVAKLSPEQFNRISAMVAEQCGGTADEVREHMLSEGFIPLRACHVAGVSSDAPAFL